MRKRFFAVLMVLALATLIAGCIEVSEIEYIEFDTYPKTTYLVGEDLELFEVVYKLKNDDSRETLSSDDDQVKKIGFSTDNPGTFTMRVYIEGYEGVSINFVYTVVNSMIDVLFAGGYGTEDEPYQIETPQQLSNMRLALDKNFILIDDIDLEGLEWTPIGAITTTPREGTEYFDIEVTDGFTGEFNGDNKTISGLSINREDANNAMFSSVEGGTVKNVSFTNATVIGNKFSALVAINASNSTFENISISSSVVTGFRAFSIAYTFHESTLKNVGSSATLNSNDPGGWITAGGMVGYVWNDSSISSARPGTSPYPDDILVFEDVTFSGIMNVNATDFEGENHMMIGQIFGGTYYSGGAKYYNLGFKNVNANGTINLTVSDPSYLTDPEKHVSGLEIVFVGYLNGSSEVGTYGKSNMTAPQDYTQYFQTDYLSYGRIHHNLGFYVLDDSETEIDRFDQQEGRLLPEE